MNLDKRSIRLLVLMISLFGFVACRDSSEPEVVIYTSLDQTFSEVILREFEEQTGIRTRAVYDTEAAKTTGLVNRLLEEQANPRADVFWNSEIVRTVVLERRGILDAYYSPSAENIPAQFKDLDGNWTGFAARARVLVANREVLTSEERPHSIFELVEPDWRGRVALANPLFGTTATHAAALFTLLGREEAESYFKALRANDVAIVAGNATSKDRVAAGDFAIGFTDTDDVLVALSRGLPVEMIFPDQDAGAIGTLLIPNTVALIRGGPNPEHGKRLIDYILSEEVEGRLAYAKGGQIPLRSSVTRPAHVPAWDALELMDVDFEAVADQLEHSSTFLRALFLE
jgi:iron(III) transport system substrate-binding protein